MVAWVRRALFRRDAPPLSLSLSLPAKAAAARRAGLGARRSHPPLALGLKTREITEASPDSADAPWRDRRWCGLATVMAEDASSTELPDSLPPPRLLDRQGWSTLLAGALLLLISFTTSYGDDNLLDIGRLQASHQWLF